LFPKFPRQKEPSHSKQVAVERALPRRLARLALRLCASLALAHASQFAASARRATLEAARSLPAAHSLDLGTHAARQAQKPDPPQPTPTPYVRRRTVSPKPEADRQTTPPQTTPPQTAQPSPSQPQPSQPNTLQPATQPATPAQSAQPDNSNSRPAGGASQPAGEEVDEDDVVRVDSNLVIIPASVVDSRGRAITDLKVEDFELRVDGEVKTIGDLSRSETPVHVALLFDNSASLSSAREFEKQAAVRFFRSVVRPIDRAAVYSISTTPTLAQGLTNDVPRLVRTVERFGKPDGATALFDAVAQAADYMRPLAGRKVLVLVSDGTDTVSDVSFDEAINRALRAECQIYVVQTRQVEDPSLHDTVSEQRMYKITEQTGGAVFVPQSVEELDAVFTQISLDLSQQYLLSYYPSDDRKDRFFRFIGLRVKTRPNLRVRARKGFYPPSAQSGTTTTPQSESPQATADRAQFGGSLTSAPTRTAYSASAPSSKPASVSDPASATGEAASSYGRSAVGVAVPAARRDASATGRAKPGPDDPEADERAKPETGANDSAPTFTLTTVAAVAPPKSAPAVARADTQPARDDTTPVTSPTPAPNPFALPAPTPAPNAPTPATERPDTASPSKNTAESDVEKRDSKASDVRSDAHAPGNVEAGGSRVEADGSKVKVEADGRKRAVSGGVLNGKALTLPRPVYPTAARNTGASGTVVVEVMIDEQGKVVEARALSGHPFLQQAAVQAARLARFSPATLSGEAVRVKGTINYVFTLP
jgi:Ca-activated chloride channel family protein